MKIELEVGNKIDINDVYMVHLTDFFPKGHRILSTYDGNKIYDKNLLGEEIIVRLGEESKSVVVPSHRNTCHFTLNTVVEATKDGAGDWSECSMAVIEPFQEHQAQFLTYGAGDSFTWGSVDLSSDAVIIVKREALEQIPEEERESWHIIVSDEVDIAKAVRTYLQEKNIPMVQYVDEAGHQMGEEYLLEDNLQKRDKAINFVRNNTFDGKSPITLSTEELAQILNIQNDGQNRPASIRPETHSYLTIPEGCMAPIQFYDLMIANGFTMNENGDIVLKSYKEIYDQMIALRQSEKQDVLENAKIETIYTTYMEYINEKSSEELTEYEKAMLEQERETVGSWDAQRKESLTEAEQNAINRRNQRLLQMNPKELTQADLIVIRELRPQIYINQPESKYQIVYQERFSRFIISPDDNTYNNPDGKLEEVSQQIAKKVLGNTAISVNEKSEEYFLSNGAVQDEYILPLQPQGENEPYGAYYRRMESYINGIKAMMEGKNVVFGEKGAVQTPEEETRATITMEELVKIVGKSESVRAGSILALDESEKALQKEQKTREEGVSLDDE